MKTLDRYGILPLDAIGALQLGQKSEAVRIVRQQLGVDRSAADELVDYYLRRHPVSFMPGAESRSRAPWLLPALLSLCACGICVLTLLR